MKTKLMLLLSVAVLFAGATPAQAKELEACSWQDTANEALIQRGPGMYQMVGQIIIQGVLQKVLNERTETEKRLLAKYKGSGDYSNELEDILSHRLAPIARKFNKTYCGDPHEKLHDGMFGRAKCVSRNGDSHDAKIYTLTLKSDFKYGRPRLMLESCYGYTDSQCIAIDELSSVDDQKQLEVAVTRNVATIVSNFQIAPSCPQPRKLSGAPSKHVFDELKSLEAAAPKPTDKAPID